MNQDQLGSFIRSLLKLIAGALITHGATKAAAFVNAEDVIGLVIAVATMCYSHFVTHAADGTNGTPNSGNKLGMLAWILAFSMFSGIFALGCAHLQPGADALVVRTEQSQTGIKAGFDLVLDTDNANRAMWKTNAPGFHDFCEWLRQPTTIGTNTLPRATQIMFTLDNVKLAYKAGRATSNDLFMALTTATATASQAQQWVTALAIK